MQHVMITGANRGIGLELTRQYLARGERVYATARHPKDAGDLHALSLQYPDTLALIPLDVTDQASVEAACEAVKLETDTLDVLINNAAILYEGDRPGTLTREHFRSTFEANVIGPAMIIQTFLPLLRGEGGAKVINVSSDMGSMALTDGGRHYSYHTSKAALNMLTRLFAGNLRPMGITVISLHPGWVQTDMGGSGATLPPEDSASGMLRVIDSITLDNSGAFYQWDGSQPPW